MVQPVSVAQVMGGPDALSAQPISVPSPVEMVDVKDKDGSRTAHLCKPLSGFSPSALCPLVLSASTAWRFPALEASSTLNQ